MNKRGGHRDRKEGPDVQLSKNLSYLLRHGAIKEGLNIDNAGYVLLSEILDKQFYKSKHITVEKIKEIVDTNEKKRFELKTDVGSDGNPALYIRATQGHSITDVSDEGLLTKIEDASKIPLALHGTQKAAWDIIKHEGMKAMTRNHMHFAIGYPGDDEVISGMRKSCVVFIELDVEKALKDGIEIFISTNKVILTRGLDGVLPTDYFKKVFIRNKGALEEIDPSEYKNNSQQKSKPPKKQDEEVKSLEKGEKNAKSSNTDEDFEYLCILDFEAQCTNDGNLTVQEIIEVPVVLVDVANKKILEDKFHHYVKPAVYPKIFAFCTELTGITQDKVDNALYINQVLDKLDEFLKEKNILNKRFSFVTCGDWDLRSCLKKEARAKDIIVKNYLKSWINLKKQYPVPFGSDVSNPDMVSMLKLSNLELIGRHHSGIDDTVNIARVVIHLLEKGFKFKSSMIANR